MKSVFFILLFSALSHNSFAQFEFKYDSIGKRNQRDIKDMDALYQVSGKGDFQLLFWMLKGQQERRTLVVLTNQSNIWQVRYFERPKDSGKLAWKELPISQEGIEVLW